MFRIKGWASFQSYKDRNPPWIRLHKNILDDYTFQMMSVDSRALLPMLWLMASEDKDPVSGLLRFGYKEIAFRLRMPEKTVKTCMDEIVAAGFVNDEKLPKSETKSICYESVTNDVRICHPETETETEAEVIYIGDFKAWYSLYPHKIGKGQAEKSYLAAIKKTDHETLMEGLRKYIQSKPPERAWCNPATWLNQQRWEDQPNEVSSRNNSKPVSKTDRAKNALMQSAIDGGYAETRPGEPESFNQSYLSVFPEP